MNFVSCCIWVTWPSGIWLESLLEGFLCSPSMKTGHMCKSTHANICWHYVKKKKMKELCKVSKITPRIVPTIVYFSGSWKEIENNPSSSKWERWVWNKCVLLIWKEPKNQYYASLCFKLASHTMEFLHFNSSSNIVR